MDSAYPAVDPRLRRAHEQEPGFGAATSVSVVGSVSLSDAVFPHNGWNIPNKTAKGVAGRTFWDDHFARLS